MFVYRYHAGGSWYALLIPRLILSSVYSSVPSVRLSICLPLSPAIFLSLSLSLAPRSPTSAQFYGLSGSLKGSIERVLRSWQNPLTGFRTNDLGLSGDAF